MPYRVRLFIDFWNYQLTWNHHMSQDRQCDWPRLPAAFVAQAQTSITNAGIAETLSLEETRVYASYNPARSQDAGLKNWLSNFLDRQPSFRVFTTERRDKPVTVYCRECESEFTECPSCGKPLIRAREKGVDTAIVTDLLSLAWEGAFEVAILVSSDADMIPCVERVQEKGFKVINASWPGRGHHLAKACWASFDITSVAGSLVRPTA
ncbi:MAG: NYN domain-containing protein [Chloroflexota bacterium]|nr:NYN domain-containing protein [Chloroflexota bacterium]